MKVTNRGFIINDVPVPLFSIHVMTEMMPLQVYLFWR